MRNRIGLAVLAFLLASTGAAQGFLEVTDTILRAVHATRKACASYDLAYLHRADFCGVIPRDITHRDTIDRVVRDKGGGVVTRWGMTIRGSASTWSALYEIQGLLFDVSMGEVLGDATVILWISTNVETPQYVDRPAATTAPPATGGVIVNRATARTRYEIRGSTGPYVVDKVLSPTTLRLLEGRKGITVELAAVRVPTDVQEEDARLAIQKLALGRVVYLIEGESASSALVFFADAAGAWDRDGTPSTLLNAVLVTEGYLRGVVDVDYYGDLAGALLEAMAPRD